MLFFSLLDIFTSVSPSQITTDLKSPGSGRQIRCCHSEATLQVWWFQAPVSSPRAKISSDSTMSFSSNSCWCSLYSIIHYCEVSVGTIKYHLSTCITWACDFALEPTRFADSSSLKIFSACPKDSCNPESSDFLILSRNDRNVSFKVGLKRGEKCIISVFNCNAQGK
jgi:hypothetical protein